MKTILTAVILLTAIHAFAEDAPPPVVSPATNTVVSKNTPESYKPGKAWGTPDASTGATRKSKKQKQTQP